MENDGGFEGKVERGRSRRVASTFWSSTAILLLFLTSATFHGIAQTVPAAGSGTTQQEMSGKPYLTFGLFIGKIEEGARIFTPVRFLPFDHPESLGHQFPTALELHQSEAEVLLHIGKVAGLRLAATLQRYPKQPIAEWKYPAFSMPPWKAVQAADTIEFAATTAAIPGLSVVVFSDRFPLAFIVDTRALTLEERGMKLATTMGLDLDRAQFLHGLTETASRIPAAGVHIVLFRRQQ